MAAPQVEGVQSVVSNYAGPYVSDMLGKSWALSNSPYQAYMGPLTAGVTENQNKAFSGIATLAMPEEVSDTAQNIDTQAGTISGLTYAPTGYQWNAANRDTYMNPYTEGVLDDAMAEARRQAEISRADMQGRMTRAGSFGGGRQAIMDAELDRNLMTTQNQMLNKGLFDAYNSARDAYLKDAQLNQQDNQFDATYDLQALGQGVDAYSAAQRAGLQSLSGELDLLREQERMGAAERAMNQEAISADYAQFQQERDYPYEQLLFQQSMLNGMPIEARDTSYADLSRLQSIIGAAGGLSELFENLFGGEG